MNYPKEIEQNTVDNWLTKGTVWPTWYGEENTYYVDQFGNEFFCKNYSDQEIVELAIKALKASWGSEWDEFTRSSAAVLPALVIHDFIDSNLSATEYRDNIYKGNLASYARCLTANH